MALKDELEALRAKHDALESRIDNLERFRSWVMGAFAVVGGLGALLADKLRKVLGLE